MFKGKYTLAKFADVVKPELMAGCQTRAVTGGEFCIPGGANLGQQRGEVFQDREAPWWERAPAVGQEAGGEGSSCCCFLGGVRICSVDARPTLLQGTKDEQEEVLLRTPLALEVAILMEVAPVSLSQEGGLGGLLLDTGAPPSR